MGVALILTAPVVWSQPASLELADQSRFWIEGSSSVNRFTCHVDTVAGHGPLPQAAASTEESFHPAQDSIRLSIPVQHFDCGKTRMTEDLQETLRADDHPTIRFRLHRASVLAPPDTAGGWYQLEALGHLTIAGTTRLIRTGAYGRVLRAGLYQLRGCKALHMTYFGVDPPSRFLGVVQVRDRIVVHFDLIAHAASHQAPSVPALTFTQPATCHD